MDTPELPQFNTSIVSSPPNATTRQTDRQNVRFWCDSKYMEENDLHNIQFEHDQEIDEQCHNNEEVTISRLFMLASIEVSLLPRTF